MAKTTRNATPASDSRFDSETVPLKALVHAIAEAKDTDASDEAKKMRGRIRRNFDSLKGDWKGLEEAKENRDGNRYPPMPRALADKLFLQATTKATAETE